MKKLISANDVRQAHVKGLKVMAASVKGHIITPEAKDLAKTLGIAFADECNGVASCAEPVSSGNGQKDTLLKVQKQIEAQLGNISSDKAALIQNLIKQELQNFNQNVQDGERQINDDGIVLVRGNAVKFDKFDGAVGADVNIKNVIGAKERSNMGVGYMGWERAFFPWTLTYDEVQVVLEGELHIKTASGTTIGKAGDVIFVPKGSSIEFGTPSHVRFVYITYPADWS